MTEIVLNRCAQGTFLSEAGLLEYTKRKGLDAPPALESIARTDPDLIAMMRENPGVYGGHCSHIDIIEVPDDLNWKIVRKGTEEWVAADHG